MFRALGGLGFKALGLAVQGFFIPGAFHLGSRACKVADRVQGSGS